MQKYKKYIEIAPCNHLGYTPQKARLRWPSKKPLQILEVRASSPQNPRLPARILRHRRLSSADSPPRAHLLLVPEAERGLRGPCLRSRRLALRGEAAQRSRRAGSPATPAAGGRRHGEGVRGVPSPSWLPAGASNSVFLPRRAQDVQGWSRKGGGRLAPIFLCRSGSGSGSCKANRLGPLGTSEGPHSSHFAAKP